MYILINYIRKLWNSSGGTAIKNRGNRSVFLRFFVSFYVYIFHQKNNIISIHDLILGMNPVE